MVIIDEINEAFDSAQKLIIYNDGNSYTPPDKDCTEILSRWNEAIDGSHPMPAFGVSLNAETEKAKGSGLWLEFVFDTPYECCGLPFEKLLVNVDKEIYGFNIIRYNEEYGYDGRCFYIDLVNKNLNDFYDYLSNISY